MNISKENFIKQWYNSELELIPDFILQKFTQQKIDTIIQKALSESWKYSFDLDTAKPSYDYCKIKNARVENYLYRSLNTLWGNIITSIRFIGGDLNKPAVFILHKDFEIIESALIKELGQFIKKEYQIFQPKRMRWNATSDSSELIKNNFINADLGYYAEFISNIKKEDKPKYFEAITFKKANNLGWYEKYKTSFEALLNTTPGFEERVQLESKEILNEIKDANLLFEAHLDGELLGIIGVMKDQEYLFEGYIIYEEFIFEAFRGKNYAAALQRHLIEQLSSEANEMIFGTIHYDNLPSKKTALRVGRTCTHQYIFADI